MEPDLKQKFKELSTALMELHKALLMTEAKALEAAYGRKVTPYELLNASFNDVNFAWLRVLSQLIVSIDTIVDETPALSGQDANQVANDVLQVLEKPASMMHNDFWTKYSAHLGNSPDIIMMHSKVKIILDSFRPRM